MGTQARFRASGSRFRGRSKFMGSAALQARIHLLPELLLLFRVWGFGC